jgi:hypothetical protein
LVRGYYGGISVEDLASQVDASRRLKTGEEALLNLSSAVNPKAIAVTKSAPTMQREPIFSHAVVGDEIRDPAVPDTPDVGAAKGSQASL